MSVPVDPTNQPPAPQDAGWFGALRAIWAYIWPKVSALHARLDRPRRRKTTVEALVALKPLIDTDGDLLIDVDGLRVEISTRRGKRRVEITDSS